MKQEMVSIPVDNAPAFLQLRDKYKQELVEDTRLTKAVDFAAKQHVLLAKMLPMHGKDLNSKPWGVNYAIGSKKYANRLVPRSVACAPRAPTSPSKDDFDAGPVQAWLTQLVKTAQGIKQSASPGGPSRPGRKPSVPPKPSFTLSAKNKLRLTPQVSTEELAQELPFSEDIAPKPWDTPTLAVQRKIRKKAAAVAKKKEKVWPRKPWSGKRGKPSDGMDPETLCCAPIPATTTTVSTRGQVI